MKIIVNTTALKTKVVICQNMMEQYTISETQTLEKDNIVSISSYLCFLEADLGPLGTFSFFEVLIFWAVRG